MNIDDDLQVISNQAYLKKQGWICCYQDDRWGWIDPRNAAHYFEVDALLIQQRRDHMANPRFREPLYYE